MIKAIVVFTVLFLLIGFCLFAIFLTPFGHVKHFKPNTPNKTCESPYVLLNDKCYFVSTKDPDNVFSVSCPKENSASLVSIESAEEMQSITDYLVSQNFAEGSQFWTSANKLNSDDVFRWSDTNMDEFDMAYSKWLPGEPDMSFTKNCLALTLRGNDVFMMSEKCRRPLHFICEGDME